MPTDAEKIADLEAANRKLRKENTKRRIGVFTKELEDEVAKLKADLATVTTERDGLQAKQGKPSELQERVDDLTKKLRNATHRHAYEKIAAAAKVKPKALDALWDSLKLKAEADEPDEKAIQAAVDAAKESHDFYFDADDAGTGTGTGTGTPPQAKPPQGGDRGGAAPRPLVLTEAQRRDPKFMHDNREAIAAAAKAGTLR